MFVTSSHPRGVHCSCFGLEIFLHCHNEAEYFSSFVVTIPAKNHWNRIILGKEASVRFCAREQCAIQKYIRSAENIQFHVICFMCRVL